jgi:MFS transporter (putative signal transducer)
VAVKEAERIADKKINYPKLLSIGSLHMGQYFPMGFGGIALPAIMVSAGMPVSMMWLLGLPTIPRSLKWLMALVVDNYGSRRVGMRKTWIIPCTVLGASLYYVISFMPPTMLTIYTIVAILVVKSFIMGAQDIAVDAFAAESMNDRDRAIGTSIINIMANLGGFIGGSLMAAYGLLGWGLTMTLAATLLILAAVPAVIRKEPPPPLASEQRRKRGERPSLIRALKRRDSRYIIPFLFAFGYAGTFMGGLFSPFLVHMGVPLPSIGGILPVAGLIGGTGTALLTPILVKRVGLRGAGIVGMCFLPIEGLTFAWLSYRGELPGFLTLIALCSALFFSTGIYGYAVSISRFRWASKAQAGTDYSLQSSLWNLGVYAGGAVAGFVAEWYGYTVYYIIAAGVATAFALCYVLMFNYVERLVQVREAAETEDVAPFDAVEAV